MLTGSLDLLDFSVLLYILNAGYPTRRKLMATKKKSRKKASKGREEAQGNAEEGEAKGR
jgi:hypothetical protein